MREFMNERFMLENPTAEALYFNHARNAPIFDFHNHLDPRELYENRSYGTITEVWLKHDHYKWRAMRAHGVDERLITGDADDFEKFAAWAGVVERLPASPLYHWAHMELRTFFGIHEPLTRLGAERIFAETSELLKKPELKPRTMLKGLGVRTLCTTDDPFSPLEWHRRLAGEDADIRVLPTFRPDKLLGICKPDWKEHIGALGVAEEAEISNFKRLKTALESSVRRFRESGCVAADHGFGMFEYTAGVTDAEAGAIFDKALSGREITHAEETAFVSGLLDFLGEVYYDHGMVMQLHMGALRNVNGGLFRTVGPDAGGDIAWSPQNPAELTRFLDSLHGRDKLPKTILFGLSTADHMPLALTAVSFCEKSPGRVQLGSAWWFNDTAHGMSDQLRVLAETGLLSGSVGMLTDSRSVTSFVRHDYYRRILCSFLGREVESGMYPVSGMSTLGEMVGDICFGNADRYFG